MNTRNVLRSTYRILPSPLQKTAMAGYMASKKRRLAALQTPGTLTFFVTTICNAKCAHCFYWAELNAPRKGELNLDEIEKIASTLTAPVYVSLTGGEPLLRPDLDKIALAFVERNGSRNIGIATNGYQIDATLDKCRSILRPKSLSTLNIQVSLDGPEATHDAIRLVPNGFKKAVETVKRLAALSKEDPRCGVRVSITVQKKNMGEVEELTRELMPLGVGIQYALVRGQHAGVFDLPQEAANDFDPKESDADVEDLEALERLFKSIGELNDKASTPFWSLRQQAKIRLSLNMLREKKAQLPCYAGKIDGVLYANGDVALCELSKPVANIRNHGLDFHAAWNCDAANDMREKISRCFCIHGCNLSTGLMFDKKIVHEALVYGRR